MRRTLVTVVLAFCTLALLAGCGGSERLSKPAYEKQVKAAGQQLNTTIQGLAQATQGKTPKQAAPAFQKLSDAVGTTANRLDDLKPPKDIESDHDTFVKALETFKGDLQKVADAAKAGDTAKLKEFVTGFSTLPSIKQAQTASEAIKKKGYDISGS